MITKIQHLVLNLCESDITQAIMNQRLEDLKSREPSFKLVLPRGIIAFIWLFLITASFAVFGIQLISFSLNLIAISKLFNYFWIFSGCLISIPLIVSGGIYFKSLNFHKNQLELLKRSPINNLEIENYFTKEKNKFIELYQAYIEEVESQLESVNRRNYLNQETAQELQTVKNRISIAINKLETLREDYFQRLAALELEFKTKLLNYQSEVDIQSVIHSQMLVEKFEEQVDAIGYYLEAVDEIKFK